MFPDTVFSADRKYRFALYREWDKKKPRIAFIGLNPSTADEHMDDPTIKRCIQFAKDWGFGSMLMGNIFAYRATDPDELYTVHDPVHGENNMWLDKIQRSSDKTVACWGIHGEFKSRGYHVQLLLSVDPQHPHPRQGLYIFGLTKQGYPKHPLYLRKSSKLVRWELMTL